MSELAARLAAARKWLDDQRIEAERWIRRNPTACKNRGKSLLALRRRTPGIVRRAS